MKNISANALLALTSDARHRTIGMEGVVVRQKDGEVMVVNEVGTRLLDMISNGSTISDLVSTLAGEFDVDEYQLKMDIIAYLEELMELNVVEEDG